MKITATPRTSRLTPRWIREGAVGMVCFALAASAPGRTVAIKAGRLIDTATGNVSAGQIILVEGARIRAVGPNLDTSGADEVIDLSRSWVLPGLMDAHTHMTLALPPNVETNLNWKMYWVLESSSRRALRGMRKSIEALEAGFTTIRDVGNDATYAMADVRRAIDAGDFVGPTIYTSGKIIAPYGGQTRGYSPDQGEYWQYEYIDAGSPDEIRKAIRRNIYHGATLIKLVTGGRYYYSEEDIKAAVLEARTARMTIAVHVSGGQAATNVINAGVDSIEHGFALSDEQMERMKERGIYLVGTDFPVEHWRAIWPGGRDPAAASARIIDRLRRADRIGVPMAFGTDIIMDLPGVTRGQMAMDYQRVWRTAGVVPAKILQCMTINVARLLRIDGERGAIARGRFADIIATPADPLDDIEALRRVNFVMKEGVVVRRP